MSYLASDTVERYGHAGGWDAARKLELVLEWLDQSPDDREELDMFLVHKLTPDQLQGLIDSMLGNKPSPSLPKNPKGS